MGIDLLTLRSCALVVVGSLRRAEEDAFEASPRRLGVDGGAEFTDEGVVGVGILLTEECEE
jgi:hypothetical protein